MVNHVEFINDAFIFCGTEEEQVKNIKAVLLCFEAVLGLEIKFFKSEIISITVYQSWFDANAKASRCQE